MGGGIYFHESKIRNATMTAQSQKILAEALDLPPTDRAELIEELLHSFDAPAREEVDTQWGQEAEDRIDAYDRGDLDASPAGKVFERLDRLPKP
jgi:putative addiction module component (TIGR02574 family)